MNVPSVGLAPTGAEEHQAAGRAVAVQFAGEAEGRHRRRVGVGAAAPFREGLKRGDAAVFVGGRQWTAHDPFMCDSFVYYSSGTK